MLSSMFDLSIRSEMAADAPAIEAVTVAAFLDAPHSGHTEQFIVAALRRAGALALSLVAERDGKVAGHVAASPVSVSGGAGGVGHWFGLGPLSVLPEFQRQGIGSRLMRAALARLKEQGAAGCVLLGDPAYYQRFGFRPEPALVLPDVPAQYFQALSLDGSMAQGTVAYHAAFGARC